MALSPMPGLPSSVTSRIIAVNDLDMYILEASPPSNPSTKPPLVLLLHGFPEMAYSWRKVMVPLSKRGYLVVAPDQRGFGQTRTRGTKEQIAYDDDLASFAILNVTADIVALVSVLGYTSVEAVVGHDAGSRIAAQCALIRPDIFKSVVIMSGPFSGPPSLDSFTNPNTKPVIQQLDEALSALDPPRKHYTMYYSTPQADIDMSRPPQGLHNFLRTYFHVKSADWKPNNAAKPLSPTPLAMSVMPHYYIMPFSQTMPQCIAPDAPSPEEVAQSTWLPEDELEVYVSRYRETGFQGGLNWYRCQTDPGRWGRDMRIFAGKRIDVPAMFMSGAQDWGVHQYPGTLEAMRTKACSSMKDEDFVLVEGAGHWVQQEQPEAVVENLVRFLKKNGNPSGSL
ncbi:alpha/beta-hydrolase [Crassisporium funariophilum]|nr:alpha/beta-hydrolase [Crassisporium funariophilum]